MYHIAPRVVVPGPTAHRVDAVRTPRPISQARGRPRTGSTPCNDPPTRAGARQSLVRGRGGMPAAV